MGRHAIDLQIFVTMIAMAIVLLFLGSCKEAGGETVLAGSGDELIDERLLIRPCLDSALCILRVDKEPEHVVTGPELEEIRELFHRNNLSLEGLQVRHHQKEPDGYSIVRCNRFWNGYPILQYESAFHFDEDGGFLHRSRKLFEDDQIQVSMDTVITGDEAACMFMGWVQADTQLAVISGAFGRNYADSCTDVRLGMSFHKTGDTNQPYTFFPVWEVVFTGEPDPSYRLKEPVALIHAQSGLMILYFNGIVN